MSSPAASTSARARSAGACTASALAPHRSTVMPRKRRGGAIMSNVLVSRTSRASGGAHTSRTMMLAELRTLLASTLEEATRDHYRHAVLEDNVLGKRSTSSRQRSFRYLRELYGLDL